MDTVAAARSMDAKSNVKTVVRMTLGNMAPILNMRVGNITAKVDPSIPVMNAVVGGLTFEKSPTERTKAKRHVRVALNATSNRFGSVGFRNNEVKVPVMVERFYRFVVGTRQ